MIGGGGAGLCWAGGGGGGMQTQRTKCKVYSYYMCTITAESTGEAGVIQDLWRRCSDSVLSYFLLGQGDPAAAGAQLLCLHF